MSAYRHALQIDANSSQQRMALAADVLVGCEQVVLLEGLLALRATQDAILCEVIDPMPSLTCTDAEYRTLAENAAAALRASPLHALLPSKQLKWLVVEDHGTGTMERWHALSITHIF